MEQNPKEKQILDNGSDDKEAEKTIPSASFQEKKNPQVSPIQRVRTYKEDVAHAVQSQKASLTSIAAAEQDRRTRIPTDITKKRPVDFKKLGIIFGSILLIIVGMGLISFFVFFYEKEEVVVEQEIPSFIFTEEQREIDVTNKSSREILQTLAASRNTVSIPLGQIVHLYITKTEKESGIDVTRIIPTEDFLTRIDARVSGAFLRSLDPTFMIGVHVFNQNQPFIILKSNSYQHTFAGLLEWERTLYNDLFLFTGRKPDPVLGIPINTQTGEEVILNENFEDRIIQNIDVRALTSTDGDIEFLYAFPNQQTLIITTNENTLTEVITRLNSVRVF